MTEVKLLNEELNGVRYSEVSINTFYDRDTIDGVIVELDIPKKDQAKKFLGIHSSFKKCILFLVFYAKSIDSVTIPAVYLSYKAHKTFIRIRLEFNEEYRSIVEDTLSSLIGTVNDNFELQFCIGASEIPAQSNKMRKSDLRWIHALFGSLATYEEIEPDEYKNKYKKECNITTFGDISPGMLSEIRKTLEDTYNNLIGIDNYKRVHPNCEVCTKPANDVHHIKLRSQEWNQEKRDRFHNLLSLCRQHHNEFHNDPKKFQLKYNNRKVANARPDLR